MLKLYKFQLSLISKRNLLIAVFYIFSQMIFAQNDNDNKIKKQELNQKAQGGEWKSFNNRSACLSPNDYQIIEAKLKKNIDSLYRINKLSSSRSTQAPPPLQWPLRQANGFSQYSYYATNNFVDLNSGSGLLDYNCGNRTYNGHNGIDIELWPWRWEMMDNNQVEVIAAAPGIIIEKDDGNFDKNCSCSGQWNAVYISHTDGSVAWYGHLKNNTVTNKAVGSQVSAGEFLGFVGSSGCSTDPHLHLEFRDINNNVIEPYAGSCNNTTSTSWWANQKPYREPTLNHLLTHDAVPINNGSCENQQASNSETQFSKGQLVRFSAYYHDQSINDLSTYTIKDPNGTVIFNWDHSSPNTYNRSWWWWGWTIPTNAVEGYWTFNVTYYGVTYSHTFIVGSVNNSCSSTLTLTTNPSQNATYHASDFLYSNVTINSPLNIIYKAGQAITLNPEFQTNLGSEFTARIENCFSTNAFETPDSENFRNREANERLLNQNKFKSIDFQVQPNPFTNTIVLTYLLDNRQDINISIRSVDGRVIKRFDKVMQNEGSHKLTFDTSAFIDGIYFISLVSQDEIITKKIIKTSH